MKKTLFISILTLSVVLPSCSKKDKTDAINSAAEQSKVRVVEAILQEVPQTAEFTTTVQPEVKNNIAGSSGRIKRLMAEVGDRVAKGQKLVQMDDANVANLQVQIVNIKAIYNRAKELYEVGGTSQQEMENAKLQLDVAETNLKTLEENTFLVSPINGIVTARYFDEGDLFAPAQYPIFTVMQIVPVKLSVNVSESYFNKVKTGMKAAVSIDVIPDEQFEGKISLVYPVIEELTRTFTVEITLPNGNMKVRPGMSGKITLDFGAENRVVIPDKAVIKQQGTDDRYVYVLNADNTVSYKKITLGKRMNNVYEILAGINDKEKVVIDGIVNLSEGKKVTVVE